MKGFVDEFKAFAMKGNVIDLAVAVVIGAAFGKIISSLVNNIIMPMVGIILGGVNFSGLYIEVGEATITYGYFIQAVVDFAIVALVIFLVVKGINATKKGEDEVEEGKPDEPSEEEKLLREIRDNVRR